MNAVFVIPPRRLSTLQGVQHELAASGYTVSEAGEGRLRTELGIDHAWIFFEASPSEVPESLRGQMAEAAHAGGRPVMVIEYSAIDLVKALVREVANDASAFVDNDHGTSLPGQEFIRKLDENLSWDWRQHSAPDR